MSASQGRYKKIAVPIDLSGWSQRAIPHAVDIARANNAELILLHVFRPPAHEYTDQIALAGQEDQIQHVREEIKQKLIGIRNELREQHLTVRVQMIEGLGVSHLICDYINNEGVDLVVMSTHGRTGISRFLFGSTAHQIMQGVHVPVLLVKPDKE